MNARLMTASTSLKSSCKKPYRWQTALRICAARPSASTRSRSMICRRNSITAPRRSEGELELSGGFCLCVCVWLSYFTHTIYFAACKTMWTMSKERTRPSSSRRALVNLVFLVWLQKCKYCRKEIVVAFFCGVFLLCEWLHSVELL